MADSDIDQLVDVITARVRARLAGALPVLAADGGAGHVPDSHCDDNPDHCGGCGYCVVRRPWAARVVLDEGAARIGAGPGVGQVNPDLARYIDHTLLKPDATNDDIKKVCDEARRYSFASVCVNSTHVPRVKSLLHGSGVMTCAVVGFPLGAMLTGAKSFEAREAVRQGADEIDMVINVGALKSRDYASVEHDIREVVRASRPARVKVILETGLLTQEEKTIAIALCKAAGAHFVKTSTGFGPGGATTDDIGLMRRLVGDELGVKASGGVRTREDALSMIKAGANRIGASASVAIVTAAASAPPGGDKSKPGDKSRFGDKKPEPKKAGGSGGY